MERRITRSQKQTPSKSLTEEEIIQLVNNSQFPDDSASCSSRTVQDPSEDSASFNLQELLDMGVQVLEPYDSGISNVEHLESVMEIDIEEEEENVSHHEEQNEDSVIVELDTDGHESQDPSSAQPIQSNQPSTIRLKEKSQTKALKLGKAKSSIWSHFVVVDENGRKISRCKQCNKTVSSKADRLKKHWDICCAKTLLRTQRHQNPNAVVITKKSSTESNSTPKQLKISDYLDSVSETVKHELDKELAMFIYSKNLPFNSTENKHFKAFCNRIRPAYNPPSRHEMAETLLEEVYQSKLEEIISTVGGKKATMMQDGWSTNQNDSVLVHAMSDGKRTTFLNAVGTEENVKTSEYCLSVLENAMEKAKSNFGVEIIACVTDNCSTMAKLRRLLSQQYPQLLVYGCNTHLLNLIGRDLTHDAELERICKVQRFFRNHHFEAGMLKKLKGRRPKLAADTRWNSQIEVMKNYCKNQAKYVEISREKNSALFDKTGEISKILADQDLFTAAQNAIIKLEPIATALDKLQADAATVADAVHHWITLKNELKFESNEEKKKFKKRFKLGTPDFAIASYMLHPKFRGAHLSSKLLEKGRSWLAERNPYYVVIFSNLQTKNDTFFPKTLLTEDIISAMDPSTWWQSTYQSTSSIPDGFVDLVDSLMKLPASTSGLERSLSTMGSIISNTRNRLSVKKAEKLCFINFHSKD